MKYDIADMELIGLVINEQGFKVLEKIFHNKLHDANTLNNISENTFQNGVLKGTVTGMKNFLYMIDDIRKEIKEIDKEGK
jgi:hypothetical protein